MNPPIVQNNTSNKSARPELPSRKLNVAEAAHFLGLSVSTLNKFRLSDGGPRYLKLGRRVLYDVRDLEQWASSRARIHTSQ